MKADTMHQDWKVKPAFAWLVFALTFGLLLSDYMSRQVMVAVFPALKLDWHLSDTQLGSLVSAVALMVGVLTFPLSVVADRLGRVQSVVFMAFLWSVATAGCGLAANFHQMFLARLALGVGEAAYGSVGAAVLFSVFPARMRGTVNGTFMAGGVFGSVIGMALGGAIAERLGWRVAFMGMGCFGLVLGVLYLLIVSERRLGVRPAAAKPAGGLLSGFGLVPFLKIFFQSPTAICACVGSGLQLFLTASMLAWLPSHLQRAYHLDSGKAAGYGAIYLLISAVGMILCGVICDRGSRMQPHKKGAVTAVFCLSSAVLLGTGFMLPTGPMQLALIAFGMMFAGGSAGPAGALVADVTPLRLHASAVALLTLANNLLGIAPGPLVTGMLADYAGLEVALRIVPWIGVAAAAAFVGAAQGYARDVHRSHLVTEAA